MNIPILIEETADGRFCARVGEPFGLTAEGESGATAADALAQLIAARLDHGAQLGLLNLPNGKSFSGTPFPADNRYQTDPSFAEMQQEIASFRRAEDEREHQQESPAP